MTIALAFGVAYSASATNIISGNSGDDPILTIVSHKMASFKVKVGGTTNVTETLVNNANSGGSFVSCGEDCQDVLIESDDATATSDSALEVGTVEVTYDGLSTSNSGEITGNAFDDGAATIVEDETTEEKVKTETYDNVTTTVVNSTDTGNQFVAAADDGVGIVIKAGKAGSTLSRLAAIGVKSITRNAP
ncbi:MAG: hypothetical protein AB1352_02445 [Patescibacteria group bacterium]